MLKQFICLVDLIYRRGPISLKDIKADGGVQRVFEGELLDRTFHRHREGIAEVIGIDILCDKSSDRYYVKHADAVQDGLIGALSLSVQVGDNAALHDRILLEEGPSGQVHLPTIIDAMKGNRVVRMLYAPNEQEPSVHLLEPYFVKVFKQRWYVIGKSDTIRVFALDGVRELEVTEDGFVFPEGMNSNDLSGLDYDIL
ncbi:MAG TPA: WYL domain-containing protein [Bacteroidales bacterium]|nr:WYL domain-containing protein [Bacteroidales bacterium]